MTGAELARRLRIGRVSVQNLEQSEAKRRITLSSLDKAAAALGCRVVYALVPEKPLEEQLKKRALAVARRLRAPVSHSMALEDQATHKESANDQDSILAEELIANLDRSLWEPDN
jgi:predicted DNA-binding mobile mystery protein A